MSPCGIPGHVGRAIEGVLARRAAARRRSRSHRHAVDRFRPVAQHHHHPSFGIELDDHVGAFVDGPDVVLRIDADRVGERETVQPFADLAQIISRWRRIRTGAYPGCAYRRTRVLWNWWPRRCLLPDKDSAEASESSALFHREFQAHFAPWPWRAAGRASGSRSGRIGVGPAAATRLRNIRFEICS